MQKARLILIKLLNINVFQILMKIFKNLIQISNIIIKYKKKK